MGEIKLTAKSALLGGARLLLLNELLQGFVKGSLNNVRLVAFTVLLVTLAYGLGGPRHPLWARMLGIGKYVTKGKVVGEVAPGFEAVREAYQRNVDDGLERGSQLVVYHKGKKVVDLYGGTLGDKYDGDTLQVVFSVTKNLSALAIAHLVSKGHLDYQAKVAKYWPEFAQNGKEEITVADVLRHEAGLAYFADGNTKAPWNYAKRDELDKMANFIAEQAPIWTYDKGFKPKDRIYHTYTRGFILQEIVRRADPAKRSIGILLKQEITGPLGLDVVFGGPSPGEEARVSNLQFDGFAEMLVRHFLGLMLRENRPDDNVRVAALGIPTSRPSKSFNSMDFSSFPDPDSWFNEADVRAAEIGSANSLSNARSLGVLADLLSRGKLLPAETHAAAHAQPTSKYDYTLCFETLFTQGGFANFGPPHFDEACSGFTGWGGYGGNQFCWNQELEVGLAYLQNGSIYTSLLGFRDPRCLRLTQALRDCLAAQGI